MYRNKVRPIPAPMMPREIRLGSKNNRARVVKWILLTLLIILVGTGAWIGYTANGAIKKITSDNNSGGSSLLSFFQSTDTNNLKGKSDGRTNILVLGMGGRNHPGGLLTDSMMVFSIEYSSKKVSMISIPRDLWVQVPGFDASKINGAFADGETHKNTTGGGGPLASKTVENVLGIPIHYYVNIDFEGFRKLVDEVGGIDIDVDKAIYDPYYPASDMIHYDPFKISVGMHHMDGALALKYARSRETTSDFDRSRRQQQVISALKDKMTTLGILSNPMKLTDIINIVGDHLRTNMQVGEMKSFWEISKTLDTDNIITKVLDTTAGGPLVAGSDSRGYYIYPLKGINNFIELQTLALNIFEQESADSTEVKIEILNGTKTKGLTTKLSQKLQAEGYDVVKVGNSAKYFSKTTVYDCQNGKNQAIVTKIAEEINAESLSKTACSNNGVDIQIVLGDDYLKSTQ